MSSEFLMDIMIGDWVWLIVFDRASNEFIF